MPCAGGLYGSIGGAIRKVREKRLRTLPCMEIDKKNFTLNNSVARHWRALTQSCRMQGGVTQRPLRSRVMAPSLRPRTPQGQGSCARSPIPRPGLGALLT